MADNTPPPRRRTLSTRIAIGLAAGVAVGLVFGERASVLAPVADGYIKLLQMTVLPYVTVSIVAGLGALDAGQARTLLFRVGLVLLLVWALALTIVLLFPLMLPSHVSASFFSTSLLQEREPFDFLNLYIPANPFNSLANNIVPAVVLFSIVLGLALMKVPDKRRLLDVLGVAGQAVAQATYFVVALTPYGLFAIAADVAGTLSFTDLERLEVYLVGYIAVSLLLSLWLLPGLVAALTPIPYRALLSRTKDALILAFMTTSLLAVIPLLTEEAKELIEDYTGRDEQKEAAVDVVVPASFNFPHTGKLLSLTFLFFAGWFSDAVVRVSDYPKLAGAGVMAMFGSVNAAIPFLLDLLKIPADTFRLFVTSSIVNARFGTLVAAVHTATVAVLGTCAVTGLLVFNARKLIRFAIVSAILIVVVVGGTRAVVTMAFTRPYDKDLELTSMKTMTDRGSARVFRTADAPPLPPVTTSVLERVKRRGVIRVGYFDDSLPYVFFNIFGDLVGFDVDMALQFARDLHVQIEFVPVTRDIFERGLDPSQCDVVMSGVAITADRATQVRFSTPYLDETVAFLVPDRFARRYSDWASVQAMGRLRIGVPSAPYFIRKIREELPNAEIVPIARLDDVLAGNHQPLDALVTTAERGSAYTLLHPEYSIAVPMPRPSKIPLAYVVAGRDSEMTSILDTWIELKRKDDTVGALFNHWILGQNVRPKERRWSILDNVLRTSK